MTVRGGATALVLAALAALLTAGAAAPSPSLGLAAWPARATVAAGRPQVVHVRNGGSRSLVLDVSGAGFGLDLRGTPRVVRPNAAARWLVIRPRILRLAPGAVRTLTVWPRVPRGARPGDHPALVLLRTRPPGGRAIGVEIRIGVVIDVRVAGAVRRRLTIGPLLVAHTGAHRRLVLALANDGDVTERIATPPVLDLYAGRRLVARLEGARREVLPHSRGVVEFVYAGPRRGPLRAVFSGGGLGRTVFAVRL
jgi:hypothetical protein